MKARAEWSRWCMLHSHDWSLCSCSFSILMKYSGQTLVWEDGHTILVLVLVYPSKCDIGLNQLTPSPYTDAGARIHLAHHMSQRLFRKEQWMDQHRWCKMQDGQTTSVSTHLGFCRWMAGFPTFKESPDVLLYGAVLCHWTSHLGLSMSVSPFREERYYLPPTVP